MATNLKSIKGITSELKAAAEYTKNGFYVSLSLDPLCPFDLVVTDHHGNSFLVDVKTESKRKTKSGTHDKGGRIYRALTKEQQEMGVRLRYIPWEDEDE
jgi:hypothetical protein